MRALLWSNTFIRAYKRVINYEPDMREKIRITLELLVQSPFHPSLHTHKLKGKLADSWACTVNFNYRILFEFIRSEESQEEDIYLLTIGTHDEVY